MESLALQVDGPITGRAYIRGGGGRGGGGLITVIFFSVNRLMGLQPEGLVSQGWGGGGWRLITRILSYFSWLAAWLALLIWFSRFMWWPNQSNLDYTKVLKFSSTQVCIVLKVNVKVLFFPLKKANDCMKV